jgi:3-oxoacid CoA-transferase subunit A
MSKIFDTAAKSLEGLLFEGMTLLAGGIGPVARPGGLVHQVRQSGVGALTLISGRFEADQQGLRPLLETGQVRKLICSCAGELTVFSGLCTARVEIELMPADILAERVIAGGAGIPAFFTRTGVDAPPARGKPTQNVDGALCVRETWLRADLAILRAWRADAAGNLMFRGRAPDFDPLMATAARATVVEVDKIVPIGAFDPDAIHTRGIYVDRVARARASGAAKADVRRRVAA